MHQSLTRSDNHFIRLPAGHYGMYPGRWLLIEGPWFDYLERTQSSKVFLKPYVKMPTISDGCEPEFSERPGDSLLWERVSVPYFGIEKRVSVWSLEHFGRLVALGDKYEKVLFNPTGLVLTKISIIEAWQCNQGILPAYIKNENWDENLEELFEITLYDRGKRYDKDTWSDRDFTHC